MQIKICLTLTSFEILKREDAVQGQIILFTFLKFCSHQIKAAHNRTFSLNILCKFSYVQTSFCIELRRITFL